VEQLGDPDVGDVEDLKFTYYDGTTASEVWDSYQEGKLPSAVRITLSIRRAAKTSYSSSLFGGSQERALLVYHIVVALPNAAVTAEQLQSLMQVDKMNLSSGGAMRSMTLGTSTSGSTNQSQ
jgi:hypothetical protein